MIHFPANHRCLMRILPTCLAMIPQRRKNPFCKFFSLQTQLNYPQCLNNIYPRSTLDNSTSYQTSTWCSHSLPNISPGISTSSLFDGPLEYPPLQWSLECTRRSHLIVFLLDCHSKYHRWVSKNP
jgi:hypothetical protein